MTHRQDAFKALQKLSRGSHKVNQKTIKVSLTTVQESKSKRTLRMISLSHVLFMSCQIAWALNKGIKADFKQYWDVELGVTYIPWSKIREAQLEELKEGGILDSDTLSPGKTRQTLTRNDIKYK